MAEFQQNQAGGQRDGIDEKDQHAAADERQGDGEEQTAKKRAGQPSQRGTSVGGIRGC